MCPTSEELDQPYLKNFFIRLVDKVDNGPLVFQIKASHSIASGMSLPATSTHKVALPNREHSQQLEAKIHALRNELVTMQTNIREELWQHRSEIQNITTMIRQILQYVGQR